MIKAVLIYSGCLYPDGPPKTAVLFVNAAKNAGIELSALPNTEFLAAYSFPSQKPAKTDAGRYGLVFSEPSRAKLLESSSFALFWDKDITLCRILEKYGLKTFNNSRAIEICDDKILTAEALSQKLPMPKTLALPFAYSNIGYKKRFFLKAAEILGFPIVIKERNGSLGEQVFLAENPEELEKTVSSLGKKPLLLQEFIDTGKSLNFIGRDSFYCRIPEIMPSSGRAGADLRIYAAGERIIAAAYRQNSRDFRANYFRGSEAYPYIPTLEERETTIKALKLTGLDFGGVDIAVDSDGRRFILEVNSNADFTGLAEATGTDVAGKILEHIKERIL